MVFRILNIKILYLAAFVFLFLFTPQENFSQQKYNFDFKTEWSWGDLIDKAVLINPQLIKSVDDLKKKISIGDARIILRELSSLESLKELKKLPEVLNFDQSTGTDKKIKWDSLFIKTFYERSLPEDLSGLIESTLILSDLKTAHNKDVFEFKGRGYLLQPIKHQEKEFEITFDYTGSEKVLNYFDGSGSLPEIFETEPYKELISKRSGENINEDFLISNLTKAASHDPLYSVYEWVNPRSLWDFGGVSVYKDEFRKVISEIRENENNLRSDVEKNISKYLPEGISFKAGLMFLFGKNNPGWVTGKNKLAIDLEYFGDDYSYLVRYIIHHIFIIAQKEIHLPVEEYVADNRDADLIRLLANILEHGSANYVGPIGTETRPTDLLEKDFQLFNRTFSHIYKRENRHLIDSMISFGYSGNAPFYTMATQMAYIIETTLGRSALIESITLGPVSFFSKYIQAYREYSDKIRRVFTFPKTFEKKISDLKLLFPENVIKSALEIKNHSPDRTDEQIAILFEKYRKTKTHNGLMNFLAGQLLLESGQYHNSKEYFLKGLEEKNESGQISGLIGRAFLQRGAPIEALSFFDMYVESSPDDHRAYELRGEYFYENGELSKAQNDFEKALTIFSGSYISENYLKKINSEKY